MNTTPATPDTTPDTTSSGHSITPTVAPHGSWARTIADFPELIWERGSGGPEVTWAAQYLLSRAISPEVAAERGYWAPSRPHEWVSASGKEYDLADREYTLAWDGVVAQRPLAIPLYQNGSEMPSTTQLRPERPLTMDEPVLDRRGRIELEQYRTTETVPAIARIPAVLAQAAIAGVDGAPDTPAVAATAAVPAVRERQEKVTKSRSKTVKKDIKFVVPSGIVRGITEASLPAPDVLPHTQDLLELREPDELPAFVTEGAHKGDAITSSAWRSGREVAALSLTGVSMGVYAAETASNPSRHAILTEGMADIVWEGRRVYITFDPDWRANKMVAAALVTLGKLLTESGAIVRILDVPDGPGIGGVDDFIAEFGDEAFFALAAEAIEIGDAERESKTYELTDVGRGDRIADEMSSGGTRYKFNKSMKDDLGVMRWDDSRWVYDDNGSVLNELAAKLAFRNPDDFVGRSMNSLKAAVSYAKGYGDLGIRSSDLDTQTDFLNTPAGEFDLATGDLYPHRQDSLNSKVTAVAPDFDSPSPAWNKFLSDVCLDDADLISYMQLFAGSMLFGRSFKMFGVLIGGGNDGKSTYQEAIGEALGEDFVTTLSAESLKKLSDEAVASLRGMRMLKITESAKGSAIDDALLKTLSSGDSMTARELFGKRFNMIPSHTVLMSTNHAFYTSDSGSALWERLQYVPFRRSFTPEERDPNFAVKLRAELPQILAWAIVGANKFADNEFKLPHSAAVQRETEKHREKADPLKQFIEDHLILGDPADLRASRTELHSLHTVWCESQNLRPWKLSTLADGLVDAGVLDRDDYEIKSNGIRKWKGVRLRTDSDPNFDQEMAQREIDKMVGIGRKEVYRFNRDSALTPSPGAGMTATPAAAPQAPSVGRQRQRTEWDDFEAEHDAMLNNPDLDFG